MTFAVPRGTNELAW